MLSLCSTSHKCKTARRCLSLQPLHKTLPTPSAISAHRLAGFHARAWKTRPPFSTWTATASSHLSSVVASGPLAPFGHGRADSQGGAEAARFSEARKINPFSSRLLQAKSCDSWEACRGRSPVNQIQNQLQDHIYYPFCRPQR